MLAADDPDACGRCHDGVVAKPSGVAFAAEGATSCTTCHDEPGGTLACGTCHGAPGRLYPPRDPCFHPEAAGDHGHEPHAGPSASRAEGLACATCHPQPALGDVATVASTHVNGHVEVWFDYAVAGREARFDATSKKCTGTCHARGGQRPEVSWSEAAGKALTCNDCHGSPPAGHYAGRCTTCHHEADATGTALVASKLHLNGRVDLGDGSGRCGACHGNGDDPWPSTAAHPAHRMPAMSKAVACETCHDVPQPGDRHPAGKEHASVRLLGLAASDGRRAVFDPTSQSCSDTYCHAGSGAARPTPRWTDGEPARTCGACHSAPPPLPHPQSTTCEGCHPAPSTTTHLDGVISR